MITTWALSSVDDHVADVLLRAVSTNLVQMGRDAPRSLVLSAFVIAGTNIAPVVAGFAVVHVPAERWLGTRRWLLVVASAHVGASAITTIGIWLLERSGDGGTALAYPVDVGVSYTLAGAAGALAWRLPKLVRPVWLAALVVAFGLWRVATGPTFTDVGHLCALAIGSVVGLAVAPRNVALGQVPPIGENAARRRARRLLVTLASAACAALGVLTFVAHTSEPIDPAKGSVTVLGRIAEVGECGTACAEVTVEYGAPGAVKTATFEETSDRPPRPGTRMLVRIAPDGSAHPALRRTPAKIDATGFFAVATVLCGLFALGMVVDGRRRRIVTPPAGATPRAG